jgi:hypothetical protein
MTIQTMIGATLIGCVLTGYHIHRDEHITQHDVTEMSYILSTKGRHVKPLRPRGYHENAAKTFRQTNITQCRIR